MRSDKQKALQLRLAGKSYNEIGHALNIPKSTLSGWFTNLEISAEAQKRIAQRVYAGSLKGLIRRNKKQRHLAIQRMRKTRQEAQREIKGIRKNELKLIGAALYWAEGYKRLLIKNGRELTHHAVALTNSDPKLIMIFLRFLREICNVADEKIHADIRIYEHMNENELTRFWREITGLPEKNFGKVYCGISKSSLGKRPFNRLPHGTILIRVNNTNLFHQIMGWIQGLSKHAGIV